MEAFYTRIPVLALAVGCETIKFDPIVDDTDADEDTDIDVVIDEYRSSSSLATISLSSVDHRGQAFSSRYFKKCFIHLFGIFDTLSLT